MTLPDLIWPCVTSAKLLWPYPFSWDLSRPFVTSAVHPLVILADLIWPQLNPYDLTRPHMTLCDLSRPPVTSAILMGPQQPFCELRRPSSWDLSQSYSISPQLNSFNLTRPHMTSCDLSWPPVTLAILMELCSSSVTSAVLLGPSPILYRVAVLYQ